MPGNHPPAESDEQIAVRCQQGDFAAFSLIYERYHRPLIAYINQIVRDYDAAACVAQDVFLSLFEHVDRFDPTRRFSTWMFACARNAALDHVQRRKRVAGSACLEVVENDPAHTGTGPAINDLLSRKETTRLLADAIAQLPQIHREIVELVAFQERSYDEAAAIIGDGVTANTLRSRMFHALRRLRTLLQAAGGEQGSNLI